MNDWHSVLLLKTGPLFWPLAVLAVLGLVLFVERTLFLHQGQIRVRPFLEGVRNLLRRGKLAEALAVCEESPGPVPQIVKAALLHHDQPDARVRQAVQSAALVEIPLLERRIGSLAAIGRVAPVLGLLGTLLGAAEALFLFREEGVYADPALFAGDLGAALLSTVFGLTVAALAYLAHHFLHGRIRAIVHDMELAAQGIVEEIGNLPDLPANGATTPAPIPTPQGETVRDPS